MSYFTRGNASDLTHKEIVALLGDSGVENACWRQNIASEFEKSIGEKLFGIV